MQSSHTSIVAIAPPKFSVAAMPIAPKPAALTFLYYVCSIIGVVFLSRSPERLHCSEEGAVRKLATVERILDTQPVPNSDRLDVVRVRGWNVVTQRNEFTPGSSAVYFEIDSFLPVRPEFEFLRPSSFKKMGEEEGFRLRTVKLRGQVSQGLVLPVATFPELAAMPAIGTDVTEILGVKKYEPPIPASISGKIKGAFPANARKTDQERIQNLWDEYATKYRDVAFEETLKLDGSSMTVYFCNGAFGVCSRNWELHPSEKNTLWRVARSLDLEAKLQSLDRNLAIQGELMGPQIQKNREKLAAHRFFVFDIWDIDRQAYLSPAARSHLVERLELDAVPVTSPSVRVFSEFSTIADLLAHADGPSLNGDRREGLVYKSLQPFDGETISFKVVSNRWLLKYE